MNDTSPSTSLPRKAILPVAFVDIVFEGNLAEIGELLTRCLFANLPFEGEDTGIRDEVPAMELKGSFMGMSVVLSGYGKADGFRIEVEPSPSTRRLLARELSVRPQRLDISAFLAGQLASLKGVSIVRYGMVSIGAAGLGSETMIAAD